MLSWREPKGVKGPFTANVELDWPFKVEAKPYKIETIAEPVVAEGQTAKEQEPAKVMPAKDTTAEVAPVTWPVILVIVLAVSVSVVIAVWKKAQ